MKTEPQTQDSILGVEEFWELPDEEGHRLELSRGRVVREPAPGLRHAHLASRIVGILRNFVGERRSGVVLIEAGFVLSADPATVRAPDVSFLSSDRIPRDGLADEFGHGAPDLAVEIVSPSNRASHMQRKALEYLEAGAGLVWIVDPAERMVTVYRSRSDIQILVPGDVLQGGGVLPNLRIPVEEIFKHPPVNPPSL